MQLEPGVWVEGPDGKRAAAALTPVVTLANAGAATPAPASARLVSLMIQSSQPRPAVDAQLAAGELGHVDGLAASCSRCTCDISLRTSR